MQHSTDGRIKTQALRAGQGRRKHESSKSSVLVSVSEAWAQDKTEDSLIVLYEVAGTAHNLLLHAGHLSAASTTLELLLDYCWNADTRCAAASH